MDLRGVVTDINREEGFINVFLVKEILKVVLPSN